MTISFRDTNFLFWIPFIQTPCIYYSIITTSRDMFLQHPEHIQIINVLNKQHITGYFRYINDILIAQNTQNAKINNILHDFNIPNSRLQFTIENDTSNRLNFLDPTDKLTWTTIILRLAKPQLHRPNYP
jgi:hypothetical protein